MTDRTTLELHYRPERMAEVAALLELAWTSSGTQRDRLTVAAWRAWQSAAVPVKHRPRPSP